ncbi:MAG: L,D-transpeptidase, partial [Caulobacteraceae bacterium]|nr:L,D-transpeptidase [Caulobacteraceae bacterium]
MRRVVGVALCVLACSALPIAAAAAPPIKAAASRPPVVREQASGTVAELASWARATGDNRGLPFVIVDKLAAKVFVFGKDGALKGSTPALLGYAVGDDSSPGIGDREMSDIAPEDRTTPAGRFLAAYGRGASDGKIFWVDYENANTQHPVVTAKPEER